MSDEKIIKSFSFSVPVELEKSSKTENKESDEEVLDDWKIGGIASTPDVDLQGEEVLQEGLDISALEAGRGLFNSDHQAGPENILGQIEGAHFIEHNGSKALVVKGYLFKHQERAKAYYNIMKSIKKGTPSRVHFSIEGKIVERDMVQSSRIKKARIDKVALTMDPVNPNTFADLVKSMQADKKQDELQMIIKEVVEVAVKKALAAGAAGSKAPADMSSGEAMTKESLDCKTKNMSWSKDKKKIKKAILDTIYNNFSSLSNIIDKK
jgi:hypothetical protein